MKTFDNVKDLNEYLRNNAKDGEEVCLDERATISHPSRKLYFKGVRNPTEKRMVSRMVSKIIMGLMAMLSAILGMIYIIKCNTTNGILAFILSVLCLINGEVIK